MDKLADSNIDLSFLEKVCFLGHFITKVILYVVFFLLIFLFFAFIIYFVDIFHSIKSNDNRPPLFNAFIIVSPSMVPNIKVQDGIIVKRENVTNLRKGDIITFVSHDSRYDGLVVTHRIAGIEKTEDGNYVFRTKGDANSREDSYLVKADDIYGKVIFKIPMIGYIKKFLSKSYWIILLIGIPALLIIVYDIFKFFDSKGKKEEELEVI